MTLFNGRPVDLDAFSEGMQACIDHNRTGEKPVNHYPEKTDEWHSWNKGWNSYDLQTETITVEAKLDEYYNGSTLRLASPEELEKVDPENPVIVDLFDIMNAPVLSDNTQAIGVIYKKPMQL